MNCIFICIFNQIQYVEMFYLLLESILIHNKLDNTEILIYTSTHFMNIIRQNQLFDEKIIKFEINDEKNNIDEACKARLDLFNLFSIHRYDKVLYLDTDIIVKGDVQPLFDLVQDEILYVLEEGEIDSDKDWWGKTLFGDEIHNYEDKTAFTSGILIFKNCEKIKNLFENINKDMVLRYHYFNDQPFIVYNAFKYNLYNNKILKSFVINNDFNIESDIIIHHFSGNPGSYDHKMEKMNCFLFNIKDNMIYNHINKTKNFIDNYLIHIIKNCDEPLEGNIFMFHQTTTYTDLFLNKAKNISNLVLNKNLKNVMEIGFNSGFSTLLMLISNPEIKITCFDLGEHKYTLPCYEKIKNLFDDRIEIIIGDSMKTLPLVDEKYDLIHIDGGHSKEVAESDILQSYRLSKDKTILIMDDYDFPELHELWDQYIEKLNLHNLQIKLYSSPHHDIKYVLENE